MSNFFSKFMNKLNKIRNGFVNDDSETRICGIPELDILFAHISENNKNAHIVILKKKSPQIEDFIIGYKKAASRYGKVFNNNLSQEPTSNEANKICEAFEDVHILRKHEYSAGIANLLSELPSNITSFIANQAHPMLCDAAYALALENGSDTSSIDISPTHFIIASWMIKSVDLFFNIPNLFETKKLQNVYYKGKINILSIFFFFFLSRIGCNVLAEPDSNINTDRLLSILPQYIKVDIIK